MDGLEAGTGGTAYDGTGEGADLALIDHRLRLPLHAGERVPDGGVEEGGRPQPWTPNTLPINTKGKTLGKIAEGKGGEQEQGRLHCRAGENGKMIW